MGPVLQAFSTCLLNKKRNTTSRHIQDSGQINWHKVLHKREHLNWAWLTVHHLMILLHKSSMPWDFRTALKKKKKMHAWHPTPVLLPGKSHGRRSLVGCSPWGHEESDTTKRLHFHFSLSCIGEGNGNPLQCSCLENPRDRGGWWAAVYGVAQGRTRLKRLTSSISSKEVKTLIVPMSNLNSKFLFCAYHKR